MDLGAWNINETDWPSGGDMAEKIKFILRYAILAPSSHNTQPWKFRLSENTIELYADRTRSLSIVDPEDRELVISCGCALYFLQIAARRFEYSVQINEFPDPASRDLLANVIINPDAPASSEELNLFNAMLKRHTNRNKYREKEISQNTLKELYSAAQEEKAELILATKNNTRAAIASLVAQAIRAQASNRYFRRELSSWVHPNWSRYSDGMPGYAFGMGSLASILGPLVLRTYNWGHIQAGKDQQLALESPTLAILCSKSDGPLAWLHTGRSLASILLRATCNGISASFLNQPIEDEGLRNKLKELINTDAYPQILLRMGYGNKVTPVPRRGVDQVLI